MFKKKPNIKALAPVRSSDRRRLADQLILAYNLTPPPSPPDDDHDPSSATTRTAAVTALRASLLPENVQSARFTTTSGPDLAPLSGTLYIGSDGVDAHLRVLWFRLGNDASSDNALYPSVYTLWRHPALVPVLHTPALVVAKLRSGADLMTPGLGGGPPFPERATRGATVAVAALDGEQAHVPVVVGRCVVDVAALETTRGAKGRAVETLHWAGDELWGYSASGKAGRQPPAREEVEGRRTGGEVEGEVVQRGVEELKLGDDEAEDQDGGVKLADDPVGRPATAGDGHEGHQREEQEVEAEAERKPLTVKELDDAFRNALLYGLHQHKLTKTGGLDFPLTQSFVMSSLIQPFLPTWTAADAKQLQIKSTSFKNLKRFLKSLEKSGLLRLKEKPTETWIADVDWDDPLLAGFKPYALPKRDQHPGASSSGGHDKSSPDAGQAAAAAAADPSIGQTIKIHLLLKPPPPLLPLLASAEPAPQASASSGPLYTAAAVKAALTEYISRESLASTTSKRTINLDPPLAAALFTSSSSSSSSSSTRSVDAEVLARGTAPRDALLERAVAACSAWHAVDIACAPGGVTLPSKARAGPGPRVKVTLETRSGNKTATRISGLERFGVSAALLAEELRKVCAGATSVEPLVGSSPKDKERLMEVMVQGPQREAVGKALERRGVATRWVVVEDKIKRKR